jgi:phosphoserine phosphatase RsbU/P
MFMILLLSILVAYVLVNRISQPLNLLAEHAKTLASNDFAAGLNIPTEVEALSQRAKDEIGNLAGSFIYMERTLQQYLKNLQETTAAKERIESELKIAHDIQMSMVPKIFPPFPHRREFDVHAILVPAKEVGGDFYDFFFTDEDHLCFAIGDVSGKGVPASLFMAVTITLLKASTSRGGSPDEILSRLNEEICRDNSSCMFVTLFTAILDIRTGRVEYSNGGHNLPYLLSDGRIQPLDNTGGMVLGAMEGVKYARNGMVLQPGDRLLLYTDGVTEAMDERENLFSERRLEEFLASADKASPDDLTSGLVSAVRRFAAGAAQSDDITILALRYWGAENHARGKDIS